MALALAIDAGTSFLSLSLCDEKTRETIAQTRILNPQRTYGKDVIRRIANASRRVAVKNKLRDDLFSAVFDAADKLCRKNARTPDEIARLSFAANSVITYLSFGFDAAGLGVYPYTLLERFGADFRLFELVPGSGFPETATVRIAPLASAFLGSDAVLGFCETIKDGETALYADLGTNGELILQTGSRLYGASAAAGSAFEGESLRCGMPALSGAICKVGRDFSYSTIENAPPRGLCATGAIDLVLAGFDAGLIRENGLVKAGKLSVADTFSMDTKEVRAFLLAKAAFYAAADTLLKKARVDADDLDAFYLSGALSEHLDPAAARAFGLFEPKLLSRLKIAPDAVTGGAIRALFDDAFFARACETARKIEVLDLAQDAAFQALFVEHINLKSR